MFNIICKLKENLKEFKNKKLDVIGEIILLIIFAMPIIITIVSIIKFYIENKISMNITDKALNTYLNIPFWSIYGCLFILSIIVMIINYFKNTTRKSKIKIAIILLFSLLLFGIMITLIAYEGKIINLNQNIINILTFNKGVANEIYGVYLLISLIGIMSVVKKLAKEEYKDEIMLILVSIGMSLIVFPLVVWLSTNIIFLGICLFILIIFILDILAHAREDKKLSKIMARENGYYMKK